VARAVARVAARAMVARAEPVAVGAAPQEASEA
jgi:hypothetical protein